MHVIIIIIGAGEVGSSIAESLSGSHDVVVVDRDPDVVESLKYSLDCLVVQGDGTSTSILKEVGVEEADMVIASTDDDEVNLVSCSTSKTVSDAFTIARVKKVEYLNTWNKAPWISIRCGFYGVCKSFDGTGYRAYHRFTCGTGC